MDVEYQAEFATRIRAQYPACPAAESLTIAEHACEKYSGRVGRSAAAKRLEDEAIDLAVRAYVRHVHTPYDELLLAGWERHEARSAVGVEVNEVLDRWRRPAEKV